MKRSKFGIAANRGGVTAKYWYQVGVPVELEVVENTLKLNAIMGFDYGKKTHMQMVVSRTGFPELLEGMFDCDFEAAIKAISELLISRSSTKPAFGEQ